MNSGAEFGAGLRDNPSNAIHQDDEDAAGSALRSQHLCAGDPKAIPIEICCEGGRVQAGNEEGEHFSGLCMTRDAP